MSLKLIKFVEIFVVVSVLWLSEGLAYSRANVYHPVFSLARQPFAHQGLPSYSPSLSAETVAEREARPSARKKILVLGGDGFCGWPTSLHLSALGHEVFIADNLSRRQLDHELKCHSLTPIRPIEERCRVWNELNRKKNPKCVPIRFVKLDIKTDYNSLLQLLREYKPDVLVHFAEQRAAPYSMKSSFTKRYTVDNNICGTHNVLSAVVESGVDVHVVHLGTMGVYGYGSDDSDEGDPTRIPEGYVDVLMPPEGLHNENHDRRRAEGDLFADNNVGSPSSFRSRKILYPANPGSVYHLTKCLDALMFQFYAKNDRVRVTDLHQGIVWGTNTNETKMDPRLVNRFDYDSDYGTVLNRFLCQAALGIPLTVYGTGGQKRAFIHISDTAKCIALAIENPPAKPTSEGAAPKVEIFNQVAETLRVGDIARMVAARTGCDIRHIENPRSELPFNELAVCNDKFTNLGFMPILLEDKLAEEVMDVAEQYKHRCDVSKVMPTSFWNKERRSACEAAYAK